jgi:maltooligosyltrehalose trehalohydrolase
MHDQAGVGTAPRGTTTRRLSVGAEPCQGGAHFRVWAPAARRASVCLLDGGSEHPLDAETDGYFSGHVPGISHGALYAFRLDGGPTLPDPASRYQPESPLGPSMVVDPHRYRWRDAGWRGVTRYDQVLYEMHVGTFTPEGTWRAAAAKLPHLAEVGVTVVEMMPANNFPGRFGWGYDGVNLFAPYRRYGEPDDLRFFVDEAHALGIGVILDVVYNHLGPGGEFLKRFADCYFNERYVTDWGEAVNFDNEGCAPVREWVISNGRYWITEFHMDGFRIDATQNIYDFDESHEHILAEYTRAVREAADDRAILVVGENEPQLTRLIRSREAGGLGLDMLWNDDFHHSAIVALTGRNEAYLTDHRGSAQEFVSAAKHGFLYQGQRYRWQEMARGTPTKGLEPAQFVTFMQNHDQIANMGRGLRGHKIAGPGRLRTMTALLLLGPGTPMLFQGEEFAASQPFWFFLDNQGERADKVYAGRLAEMSQFKSLAEPELQAVIPRPEDPATFERCKLDWSERQRNQEILALYRDLLRLRREDVTLRAARRRMDGIDGAVLGPEAFCLRFFGPEDDDRLLLINLGFDLELLIMPEPLLAPPEGHDWELLWSSEHPKYGGTGAQHPRPDAVWVLPGHGALLLRPGPASAERRTELDKALAKAAQMRAASGGE